MPLKRALGQFFTSEWLAIRSPYSIALLTVALTFALLLQYFPQYAGMPDFQTELGSSLSVRWIVVNGIALYLLVRIAGMPGVLAKIYVSFIAAVNLTSIIYFGSRLTYGAIASGFETNVSELKGLFVTVGLTPVVIFLGSFAFFVWCASKSNKTDKVGVVLIILLSSS